jgi:hypothetical protein
MRHTLRLSGVIVGHSELEHAEPELGRAHGAFRPGLGYDLVQPIFRLFAEAVPPAHGERRDEQKLERYYKAREALPLELQDAAGRRIATTAIHIADYRAELGNDALELDVLISDDDYWQQRDESH